MARSRTHRAPAPQPELTPLQKQIRRRRERLGLTQAALGRLIDVDQGAISHWETGISSPRTTTLPKLALALKTTVAGLHVEAA